MEQNDTPEKRDGDNIDDEVEEFICRICEESYPYQLLEEHTHACVEATRCDVFIARANETDGEIHENLAKVCCVMS